MSSLNPNPNTKFGLKLASFILIFLLPICSDTFFYPIHHLAPKPNLVLAVELRSLREELGYSERLSKALVEFCRHVLGCEGGESRLITQLKEWESGKVEMPQAIKKQLSVLAQLQKKDRLKIKIDIPAAQILKGVRYLDIRQAIRRQVAARLLFEVLGDKKELSSSDRKILAEKLGVISSDSIYTVYRQVGIDMGQINKEQIEKSIAEQGIFVIFPDRTLTLRQVIYEVENVVKEWALKQTNGNVAQAAQMIGISKTYFLKQPYIRRLVVNSGTSLQEGRRKTLGVLKTWEKKRSPHTSNARKLQAEKKTREKNIGPHAGSVWSYQPLKRGLQISLKKTVLKFNPKLRQYQRHEVPGENQIGTIVEIGQAPYEETGEPVRTITLEFAKDFAKGERSNRVTYYEFPIDKGNLIVIGENHEGLAKGFEKIQQAL